MKTLNQIQESLFKKLNKDERLLLEGVLSDMKRTQKFILKDDIEFCNVNKRPYGTSFINKEGLGLDPMNKQIGSDLCYLYNAINRLTYLLATPVEPQEIEL